LFDLKEIIIWAQAYPNFTYHGIFSSIAGAKVELCSRTLLMLRNLIRIFWLVLKNKVYKLRRESLHGPVR